MFHLILKVIALMWYKHSAIVRNYIPYTFIGQNPLYEYASSISWNTLLCPKGEILSFLNFYTWHVHVYLCIISPNTFSSLSAVLKLTNTHTPRQNHKPFVGMPNLTYVFFLLDSCYQINVTNVVYTFEYMAVLKILVLLMAATNDIFILQSD